MKRCLATGWVLTIACIVFGRVEALESSFERQFERPKLLLIEGRFLDVYVEGEERQNLIIKGSLEETGPESSYEWVIDQLDNYLRLRVNAKSSHNYNVEGKVVAVVPKDIPVKVINSSGDISVNYLCSRNITLSSSSGNIILRNCHGDFKVSAASGEITASHLCGRVQVRTSSGHQYLQKLRGSIAARTNSGEIEAYDLQGEMEIESICGPIIIDGAKGNLELETKTGTVKVLSLQVDDEAVLSSTVGNIYLETEQGLDHYNFDLSTRAGVIQQCGHLVGHQWSQEKPELQRHIKINSQSGSIQVSSRPF